MGGWLGSMIGGGRLSSSSGTSCRGLCLGGGEGDGAMPAGPRDEAYTGDG